MVFKMTVDNNWYIMVHMYIQLHTYINIYTRMCVCVLSCVWLFVTPWTAACQVALSMGFSRQEYRSGLPFPTPGNVLEPGVESVSLMSVALADRFFTRSHLGSPLFPTLPFYLSYVWLCCAFTALLVLPPVVVHRSLIVVASLVAHYGL